MRLLAMLTETLIYSDFVAIPRCKDRIVPYIFYICCVTVKVTMSQFYPCALSCVELEINQSFLRLRINSARVA